MPKKIRLHKQRPFVKKKDIELTIEAEITGVDRI